MTDEQEIYEVFGVRKNIIDQSCNKIKLKHGMFANTPIICKGDLCPYKQICSLPINMRIIGTRCPMEAGALIGRFKYWLEYFKIETENGEFKPEDRADVSLIADLVKIEVMLIRTENKIAIDGDFIAKTIVDVDKKCHEHLEDTIHPAIEYQMKLFEKKEKTLRLLNATRADNKDKFTGTDPTAETKTIIQIVKQKAIDKKIDINNIDFDNMEDVSIEQITNIQQDNNINDNDNVVIDNNQYTNEQQLEESKNFNDQILGSNITIDITNNNNGFGFK